MTAFRLHPKRILIDIDTQRDLLTAKGAASVYNHRRLLVTIRRVMAAARHNHIPTISTALLFDCSHRNPGFCLAGTEGLKKVSYTVRDTFICYPPSDSTDLPAGLLNDYHQVVFCKRTEDPFEEPRLDRLLTESQADEYYLIGATAEGAVKATVRGLLDRGRKVTVLTDAVGTRDKAAARHAFREMAAIGVNLSKAKDALGCSMLKTVHACGCKRCRTVAAAS